MNEYNNFNKIMVKSVIGLIIILSLFFFIPQLGTLLLPIIIISLFISEYRLGTKVFLPRHKKVKYGEYLQSEDWQEIRGVRLWVDGNKCQSCGSIKHLHVHHLTYKRLGHEEIEDLVTVCKDCHKELHDYHGKNAHYYPLLRSIQC